MTITHNSQYLNVLYPIPQTVNEENNHQTHIHRPMPLPSLAPPVLVDSSTKTGLPATFVQTNNTVHIGAFIIKCISLQGNTNSTGIQSKTEHEDPPQPV